MARRNHQQRVGRVPSHPAEGAQHRLLLAPQRACRDEHRPRPREVERGPEPVAGSGVASQPGPTHPCDGPGLGWRRPDGIELQAAGDHDAGGVRPDRNEPPPPFLRLRADAAHVGQHPPHAAAGETVAPERAVGQAAVDQEGDHSAPPAGAEQIRPDLGIDHHEQLRRDPVQGAVDERRKIERRVTDGVDVGAECAGHPLSGRGRGGQDQAMRRMGRPQRRQQRPRRQDFADGHRVHPDRRPPVGIDCRLQAPEPLAHAPGLLAAAPYPDRRRRQHRQEPGEQQHAVQVIHRGRAGRAYILTVPV